MNATKLLIRIAALTLAASFVTGCVIVPPRQRVVYYPGYHPVPVRPVVVYR